MGIDDANRREIRFCSPSSYHYFFQGSGHRGSDGGGSFLIIFSGRVTCPWGNVVDCVAGRHRVDEVEWNRVLLGGGFWRCRVD